MGHFIIKLTDKNRDWYLVYSTVVDAPITCGMTRDGLEKWCTAEYGRLGMQDFEDRMKRVEEKGTSSRIDDSLDECLSCNRAGPNETNLTKEQILEQYCYNKEA